MLSEGYAVAASSRYQGGGWALFTAIDDNRDLLDEVRNISRVARPARSCRSAARWAGSTALKLAEADGFPPVEGVYALCPAAAGARFWDAGIDLRLAYDVGLRSRWRGGISRGRATAAVGVNLSSIPDSINDLFD